jgi:hypothetical protein
MFNYADTASNLRLRRSSNHHETVPDNNPMESAAKRCMSARTRERYGGLIEIADLIALEHHLKYEARLCMV